MIYFREKNIIEVFAEAKNTNESIKSLTLAIIEDYTVNELGYFYRLSGDSLETAESEINMNWGHSRREEERGKISSFAVSNEVIDFIVNSGIHSDTLYNTNVKLYGKLEKGKITFLIGLNTDLCNKYYKENKL